MEGGVVDNTTSVALSNGEYSIKVDGTGGGHTAIYNAGTIDTNIIEISGGGQLYNATTGVIEATTIKTSGGGQQIGWDQAANKPILREEKIINEGRIKASEISSNGMQGELYNGCLIRADKISVKQLNLKSSSAIEVPTIECNEYYLRKDCIVRATTLRTVKTATVNDWSAICYADGKVHKGLELPGLEILDRVGGGDSFGGGLIYALLNGKDTQSAIEFAVAASCLKHTIEGDVNMVSVSEVETLATGDGSGRVQR